MQLNDLSQPKQTATHLTEYQKTKKRRDSYLSLTKTCRDILLKNDISSLKSSKYAASANNINKTKVGLSAKRIASEKTIQSICIGKMKEKFTKCFCDKLPLCNTSLCLCRKNGLKCNFKCHQNSMCIWKH